MAERFDVAILGAGPAGEHAANALLAGTPGAADRARADRRRVHQLGLHPHQDAAAPDRGARRVRAGRRAPPAELDWPELARYRDYMTSAGDDSARVKGYEDMGVNVVKGDGRLAGPGRLEVEDRQFEAERSSSAPARIRSIPPVEGLGRGRLLDQPRGHRAGRDPGERDRRRRRPGRGRAGPVPAPLR